MRFGVRRRLLLLSALAVSPLVGFAPSPPSSSSSHTPFATPLSRPPLPPPAALCSDVAVSSKAAASEASAQVAAIAGGATQADFAGLLAEVAKHQGGWWVVDVPAIAFAVLSPSAFIILMNAGVWRQAIVVGTPWCAAAVGVVAVGAGVVLVVCRYRRDDD